MMKLKILLVVLLSLFDLGSCSNEILILKYNKCKYPLEEIPIKANSPLKEFTFCAKYSFQFIRQSLLMGFDEKTFLLMMAFEEKMAAFKFIGSYFYFDFGNQNIKPDEWQNLCISVSGYLNQMKIVLNGENLPEILKEVEANISNKKLLSDKLWLGGIGNTQSMLHSNRRLVGSITQVQFWNESLSVNFMKSITKYGIINNVPKPNLFSWSTFKKKSNSSCIEVSMMDEKDELFMENYQKNVLIEYLTDFNSSNYICQAFGGTLLIPTTDQELKEVESFLQKSETCTYAFTGLKKLNQTMAVDLSGKISSFVRWGDSQPNGNKFQQCICIRNSIFDDCTCHLKYCFTCQIMKNTIFKLRGNLTNDIDREYIARMSSTNTPTEIRGFKKTECIWKDTWHFGQHLKLDIDQFMIKMPPVGVRKWNNGQMLKFTNCNETEFTCHTYGHCISRNKRCDGHPDCPKDGSDEHGCKTLTLDEGYDKKFSSQPNTAVRMYVQVQDIMEIDELNMVYTAKLKIKLQWFDDRLVLRNLKEDYHQNLLNEYEIDELWAPGLLILNSNQVFIRAGEETEGSNGIVRVHKKGLPQQNALSEIDEDYMYPGTENYISMVNYVTVKLHCKFDLQWFPFDTQKCPVILVIPNHFTNQFVLNWLEPPTIKPNIKLTQYEVLLSLEYPENISSTGRIEVKVLFCRKLSYHIMNIYLPTLCLAIIAGMTLLIDLSHFEATIMVALTSMLVTYTLYQSISEYLPHTSYLKMIDIWLIGGLLFPFFIITILVIMDILVFKEKDDVTPIRNEEKNRLTSKLFLRIVEVVLIITFITLSVIYWIVGLYHYYVACNNF